MRVRRGLKGTLRVTLPPSHERKTGEIRLFFFFFLHSYWSLTMDRPREIINYYRVTRFLDLRKIKVFVIIVRVYICISRLGLFGIIQVWKKKRKNK